MIENDQELKAMWERIERFQQQVERLRQVETDSENYRHSAGGYLAEIDRMNLEIREYLSSAALAVREFSPAFQRREVRERPPRRVSDA